MNALIRSELVQARTLRSTYGIGLLILLMAVGITWADLSEATALATPEQRRAPMLADVGLSVAFVGAILAATRVAGEYRHGTITHRLLAAPNRGRLAAATLLTWIGMAVAVAIVATLAGLAVTTVVLGQDGLSPSLGAGDVLVVIGRIALGAATFTAIGATIGFITRSQQAAAIVVFAEFLAEKAFGGLLGGAAEFLPFALLQRLLDEQAGQSAAAALVLTGLAATLGVAAVALLRRRDITP